jgi:steroid delta-isomerase-like uncharacterized protein
MGAGTGHHMTANQNLQVMAQYNELWSLSRIEQAEQVLDANFIRYGTSGSFKGIPAFKRYVTSFLTAFPDLRFSVEDCLVHGEKVTLRYRFTGTHRGSFLGVPSTEKRVNAEGAAIYRIVNGKLLALWDYLDLWGLLEQFGVLPFALRLE